MGEVLCQLAIVASSSTLSIWRFPHSWAQLTLQLVLFSATQHSFAL